MIDRPEPPRVLLVTLHYPLDMSFVGSVLVEAGRAYPGAVVDEQGRIWSRRFGAGEKPPSTPPHPFVGEQRSPTHCLLFIEGGTCSAPPTAAIHQ